MTALIYAPKLTGCDTRRFEQNNEHHGAAGFRQAPATRELWRASYNPNMRKSSCRGDAGARGVFAVAAFVLLSCLSAMAGKDFVMPAAQPARTYPAHDEHGTEKVAVAVDPYDMGDKAQIFSVNYREYEYLPVFLVVTNDGDQPVSLGGMKVQLVTVGRDKLGAATVDDLQRRLAHPQRNDRPSPVGIPLPGSRKVKGAVSGKTLDEINRAMFSAKAIEPHTTRAGFVFFDVSDISTPLAGANFYLTGVQDAGGNELMYFEIPMEKYLSAPQAKKP
jgi:hypothetical protein